MAATCHKYYVSSFLFYQWRGQTPLNAKNGPQHGQTALTQEMRRIVAEKARLEKLLAEKELLLDLKEELLKKVYKGLLNVP